MKNRAVWIIVVALLLGATSVWGYREKSMEHKEIKITNELRSLNRLLANYSRHLQEYDTTDDSKSDTTLWSEDKTTSEAKKLLKQLLQQREALRHLTSDEITYQQRVERWWLNLQPHDNQYQNILRILYQFANARDSFKPLLSDELEVALKRAYYREALMIVRWSMSKEEELSSIRPRFGNSPEGSFIDLLLLEERYHKELEPIEQQLLPDTATDADQKWVALAAPLERRGREVLSQLEGTSYATEAQNLYSNFLGERRVILSPKVTNTATSEATIELFGIFPEATQLYRNTVAIRQVPTGIVRMTLTDQLPKVGHFYYSIGRERYRTYLTYEQIIVLDYNLKDHNKQIEVLDRTTGAPVANVRIDRFDNNRKVLGTIYTDQEGRALFQSKPREGYWISVKDNRLAQKKEFYIPNLPEAPLLTEWTSVSFYTDRPIYRRGQELKVGITATAGKGGTKHILPNYKMTVALKAMRNFAEVTIATQEVRTDNNGVAELTFSLPTDEHLSDFSLETGNGYEKIEVQDYKRSYLTIQLDSLPTGYVMGRPMTLMGKTTDLNDLPTPATIRLTYGDNRQVEVTSGSDGAFTLTTPAITDRGTGNLLTLDASDALGNTAHDVHLITCLNTDMPLNADLLPGNTQNINKESFTLNTSSQPYNHRYLGSLMGRKVMAYLVNGKEQIAIGELAINGEKNFSLPDIASGTYRLLLTTTDGYGKEIKSESRSKYYLYSSNDSELTGTKELFGELLPSGELLFGSSNNATLILSLKKKDITTYKEYIRLSAGTLYKHRLPLADNDWISLNIVRGMEQESINIALPKEQIDEQKTHVEGLTISQPLLPGSQFQRTLRFISKKGTPLAGIPVIATVFDKAVSDAAKAMGVTLWEHSHPAEPMLYGSLRGLALTSSADMMFAKTAVARDEATFAPAPSDNSPTPLRTNFAETAYFSALLQTDESGELELHFKLPDSQTKYITKLYAFTPNYEEELMEEATFEVYSPLSIELSTPRFLTWGDRLNGEAQIRNTGDVPLRTNYCISSGSKVLAQGSIEVAPNGTTKVPFSTTAPEHTKELTLQATIASGTITDGVERKIPLQSNLSTYIVAQPLSLYKQYHTTLQLPKMEQATTDLTLQLYLDPLQLLLSKLAISHQWQWGKELSLFSTLHCYALYSRLNSYLKQHPELSRQLKEAAQKLEKIEGQPANWGDRMADPKSLATFYKFITNPSALTKQLATMEQTIQSHAVLSGGFRYSTQSLDASPWLTHYILDLLSDIEPASSELKQSLKASLPYLVGQLKGEHSRYKDFIGFAIIAHSYRYQLPNFGTPMEQQLNHLRRNYQRSNNSTMLRFARYSRLYDQPAQYKAVRQFIEERSHYTYSDDELLSLKLFLSGEEQKVSEELVKFALQTKQNTIWHNRAIVDVAEVILDKVAPTKISPNATIAIGGKSYKLSPQEQTTGAITIRYPGNQPELQINLRGVQSDYIFGGVSYLVTEPSATATPTGEKLTIEKQVYVRKVDSLGRQTFRLAKDIHKGDRLVVRYLIESKQDLSLVSLLDPRVATAEFGYDFEGYSFGDKLWFGYDRRDTQDLLYMDYLPRGRHRIELEATATQAGDFTYGPAQIQSYYAPEYAGNSSGGSLTVE